MQSDELRRLRQSLGWNQARLGDEVGVSANTVARWERGASLVPKAVARLIRMLAADAAPSAVGASSGIARDTHHAAILKALSGHLDPEVFEACAADLLRQQWPGLVPVRGGSDDGFDGAIATDGEEPFPLVTTTGTAAKDNLRRNLKRAIGSGWTPKTAIFATSRRVTPKTRKAMRDVAREFGITLAQIYDQEWFANSLYRESGWCKRLLGVTGRPSALSIIPVSNRPVIGDRVIGRDACLEQLRSLDRDCLLVAGPGAGKTFVLRSLALEGVGLFLADDDREEIANALREQAPAAVIVDDAHVDIARLKLLQQLRTELHATFRIVAAGW
ncbi:MAG: helix-turn-helix domain-containing protein, partial [Nitratireductor sp.]